MCLRQNYNFVDPLKPWSLAYYVQVSDSEDFPDVTKCLLGCRAIFPGAFFAGVRSMPGISI